METTKVGFDSLGDSTIKCGVCKKHDWSDRMNMIVGAKITKDNSHMICDTCLAKKEQENV